MTAFIVQAREEAVRRNQAKKFPPGHLTVFALGAVWGREQEPTDEEITAVARAINVHGWTCNGGYHEPGQYDECAECREACGDLARAALTAAREARA